MKKMLFVLLLTFALANVCGGASKEIHGYSIFTDDIDMQGNSINNFVSGKPCVYIGPHGHDDYITSGSYPINDAINDSIDDGNYNIVIDPGTFVQDGPIVLDVAAFHITGAGVGQTIIKSVDNSMSQFRIGKLGLASCYFVIEDMTIWRDTSALGYDDGSSIGIEFRYGAIWWPWVSTIQRVWVYGSDRDLVTGYLDTSGGVEGLVVRDSTFGPDPTIYGTFRDRICADNEYGIQISFDRCVFSGFSEAGFKNENLVANSVSLYKCYANGVDVGQYCYLFENGGACVLVDCGGEAATVADLYIKAIDDCSITDSFFGGAGSDTSTGHSMLISSVNDDVTGLEITNTKFQWTNGWHGLHYNQAPVEIYDGAGGFIAWIQFSNCKFWDTGFGALNMTDVWQSTVTNCVIEDRHVDYGVTTTSQSSVNLAGSIASDSIVSNNFIDSHKYGITVSGSLSQVTLLGNRVKDVSSSSDAYHITTSESATVISEHNSNHA